MADSGLVMILLVVALQFAAATQGEEAEKKKKDSAGGVQLTVEAFSELYERAYFAERNSDLRELRRNHSDELKELRSKHRDEMSEVQSRHKKDLKNERELHNDEVTRLKNAHRLEGDKLRAQIKSLCRCPKVTEPPRWAKGSGSVRSSTVPDNWNRLVTEASGTWAYAEPADDGVSSQVHAVLNFRHYLRVHSGEWTAIPIVKAGLISSNWVIGHAEEPGTKGGRGVYTDLETASFETPSSTESILTVTGYANENPDTNDGDDNAHQTHILATNKPGLYRIEYSVLANVKTVNKNKKDVYSFSLSNLHFPINSLNLNILVNGTKNATTPVQMVHDFSTVPVSHVDMNHASNGTLIAIRVPVTRNLDAKWRMGCQSEDEATESEKNATETDGTPSRAAAPLTVKHEVLHSIQEGNIISSEHNVKYTLDQDESTLPDVRIRVYPEKARVTSVIAHGLNTWHMAKGQSGNGYSVVVLNFERGLTNSITVRLGVELDFSDQATETLAMPKIFCEGVLRQSGVIAISKASTMEVHEGAKLPTGMSRTSIGDLSEDLKFRASKGAQVVFAFKYMNAASLVGSTASLEGEKAANESTPELILSVKAHEAIQLLDAIVENAHHETLVMDNGRSMHRLILTIQNTKVQYLKISNLPSSTKVWSLNVNTVSAKPVIESEAEGSESTSMLIPLLIGLPSKPSNKPPKTSVELVYATKNNFLSNEPAYPVNHVTSMSDEPAPEGVVRIMDLTPPLLVGLPIEALSTTVQFPSDYSVFFSSSPRPRVGTTPTGVTEDMLAVITEHFANESKVGGPSSFTGPLKGGFSQKMPKPISHAKGRKVVPKDYEFGGPSDETDGEGAGATGISIDLKKSGTAYKFERMLLENEQAPLFVVYQQKPEATEAEKEPSLFSFLSNLINSRRAG